MIFSNTVALCGPITALIVHKERRSAFETALETFVLLGVHPIPVPTRSHTLIELFHVQSDLGRVGLQITRFNGAVTLVDQIVKLPELALFMRALTGLSSLG